MSDRTTEQLAAFVQEYVRREGQDDAGVLAVIAADLRDPMYLPHHVAERLLSTPEIQAAIKAARSFYKPPSIASISADTILADAEQVFQRASDDRQYTAALAAKKLQAEIKGVIRRDVNVNIKHTIQTMSDAELEKIAKRAVIDGEFTEVSGVPAVIDVDAQSN